MNDVHARLLELERRQSQRSYALQQIGSELLSLENDVRTQAQQPAQTGGGTATPAGPINLLKWANEFCFKVDFGSVPTFSSAGSNNATLDAAAFSNAVAALAASTRAPARYLLGGDLGQYGYPFSQSVYWQDGEKPWQMMLSYGEVGAWNYPDVDPTYLWNIGWSFQCGWFPHSEATLYNQDPHIDPEYVDVAERFVPCVSSRLQTDETSDWNSAYGEMVLVEAEDSARYIRYDGRVVDGVSEDGFYFGNRLAKWVWYARFNADGSRRGWAVLSYVRTVHDSGSYTVTPYIFEDGPESGTTGAYQFPAEVRRYATEGGGSTTPPPLGSNGVADIYVSWGATCDVAVPPITNEEPEDWGAFCADVTSAAATWLKIPGLTVKVNGTVVTSSTLGSYSSPPVVTFEFSSRLQDYLAANPDVSITYAYGVRCDPPPFNPQTGSGTASHGSTVTPPRNTTCAGTKDTQVSIDIKMEASPSRALFTSECCTPLGLHCGVTVLNSATLEYYIDPL